MNEVCIIKNNYKTLSLNKKTKRIKDSLSKLIKEVKCKTMKKRIIKTDKKEKAQVAISPVIPNETNSPQIQTIPKETLNEQSTWNFSLPIQNLFKTMKSKAQMDGKTYTELGMDIDSFV